MFYTTGNLPIAEADRDYFFKEWLHHEGTRLRGVPLGDRHLRRLQAVLGHGRRHVQMGIPGGRAKRCAIAINDTNHPASRPLGDEFVIKDEIYQYKNYRAGRKSAC